VLQQFKIANGEKLDITEDPTPEGTPLNSDQWRGRRTRFCRRPVRSPSSKRQRAWCPAGLRCRDRFGDRRPVRFDAAKLIVYAPAVKSPRALAPRPRRIPRRRTGDRHPVPPRCGADPAFIATTTASRCTRAGSRPSEQHRRAFTAGEPLDEEDARPRHKVVVEVGGRRLEVSLPAPGLSNAARRGRRRPQKPKPRKRGAHAAPRLR